MNFSLSGILQLRSAPCTKKNEQLVISEQQLLDEHLKEINTVGLITETCKTVASLKI